MQTEVKPLPPVIVVGHSSAAPGSANALRVCFTKASAVRVLHMRGLERDHARAVVGELAAKGPYAYRIVTADGNSIEVQKLEPCGHWGWSERDMRRNRAYWNGQPEA